MRWFLDMCIILGYINEGDNQKIINKTISFVNQKKEDKFVLCYYIKEDNLPKWLNRKRIIFREILRQIKDTSYKPYSDNECSQLWEKDKNQVLKLAALSNTFQDKTKIIESFENVYQEIERRIKEFIEKEIDELVVPIKEIDLELRSSLFTYLGNNMSDANTLASGIQENKNKEVILITADKQHWTKDNLEWALPEHSQLRKEYPHLPGIKYIQEFK
jgi:hypothetical protein